MKVKRKWSIGSRSVQTIILIALIGLAIYLLFSYVVFLLNSTSWKTLTDEQYGFSFEYPSSWDSQVYGESGFRGYHNLKAAAFADLPPFFTNVNRSVRIHWMLMENPTLEQVALWGAKEIEQYDGFNASKPIEVQIGVHNYPAMLQTYQTRNLFKQVYYLYSEDSAYILELRAGELNSETESIFEHVLATFQLLERSQE